MAEVPVELVVAAFTDEDGASRALKDLKAARKENLVGIRDAAVIRRDQYNKLHIAETGDMSGGKGAVIGGLVGAAIGIVAAPAVLVAGAVGAAVGGLAARLRDSGFPDERLRDIGNSLKPGTSALIAVIEHKWVAQLEQQLAQYGAQVVTEAIKSDIAEQLEAGQEVSYTAVSAGDDIIFDRTVTTREEAPAAPGTGEEAAPPPDVSHAQQPPAQPE